MFIYSNSFMLCLSFGLWDISLTLKTISVLRFWPQAIMIKGRKKSTELQATNSCSCKYESYLLLTYSQHCNSRATLLSLPLCLYQYLFGKQANGSVMLCSISFHRIVILITYCQCELLNHSFVSPSALCRTIFIFWPDTSSEVCHDALMQSDRGSHPQERLLTYGSFSSLLLISLLNLWTVETFFKLGTKTFQFERPQITKHLMNHCDDRQSIIVAGDNQNLHI